MAPPHTTLPRRVNRRRALGGYAWLAGLLYFCLFSLASYAGFVALSITSHLVLAQCNGDLPHPPHPPLAPHRPLHPGYGRSLELSLHALHGPSGGYPSPSTHLHPVCCRQCLIAVFACRTLSHSTRSPSHTCSSPALSCSSFPLPEQHQHQPCTVHAQSFTGEMLPDACSNQCSTGTQVLPAQHVPVAAMDGMLAHA